MVIGGGMAGLAAACELGRSGIAVSILEARDRLGGRVLTHDDPALGSPIEFGAEFIHGKPREIWSPLRKSKIEIAEVNGDNWCAHDNRVTECDFWSDVDSILKKMDDSSADESFSAFLNRCCGNAKTKAGQQAKIWAKSYVTGFNAADPALVGVHWLVEGMNAEEKIEGDRAFRSEHGYKDLLDIFQQELRDFDVVVHTETIVETLRWVSGNVRLHARARSGHSDFEASRVLITIPLSLLQASVRGRGGIDFKPALPQQKIDALDKFEMGKVVRIVLRFRERFWEAIKPSRATSTLSHMSFLFSQDEWFPTWWTTMPKKVPLLTGWAPFRCAERLSGQSQSFVIDRSLQTLSALLGLGVAEIQNLLVEAYFHDWQSDPFSLGAYSYGKVGSRSMQKILAGPVQNTLYFAGEAADTTGHNGTVHGAIASGHRAARQILRSLD